MAESLSVLRLACSADVAAQAVVVEEVKRRVREAMGNADIEALLNWAAEMRHKLKQSIDRSVVDSFDTEREKIYD